MPSTFVGWGLQSLDLHVGKVACRGFRAAPDDLGCV